jgi:hypothetical protein
MHYVGRMALAKPHLPITAVNNSGANRPDCSNSLILLARLIGRIAAHEFATTSLPTDGFEELPANFECTPKAEGSSDDD